MTFKDLFQSFDLGPSLMDEVFSELDITKPELTEDSIGHQQKVIRECNANDSSDLEKMMNDPSLRKVKMNRTNETVKSISPAEEQDLEQAIAMAKELASLSMMEPELKPVAVNEHSTGVSVKCSKTQTSPIKKKFSFKFKNSFKGKRKNFCEKAENISDIQSMLTEEAKLAYSSLIEKGSSRFGAGDIPSANASANPVTTNKLAETDSNSYNPIRFLQNGLSTIQNVRGNKQRIAITPQTASLARLTANINRMNAGVPVSASTPATGSMRLGFIDEASSSQNQPPLPPRDSSREYANLQQQRSDFLRLIPRPLAFAAVGKDPEFAASSNSQTSNPKPNSSPLKRRLSNESQATYVNYVPPPEYVNTQYFSSNGPKRILSSNPPKPPRTFL